MNESTKTLLLETAKDILLSLVTTVGEKLVDVSSQIAAERTEK